MEYSRQEYINKLSDRKNNGLIKIITGARRSGKSFLLNELYYRYLLNIGINSKSVIRFAFDSDEDIDLLDKYYPEEETKIKSKNGAVYVNSKKFRSFINDKASDAGEYYLFLDEVQLLENFTGTLNGFLKHKNYDIYVTGSNSRFLSSDIATEFKGRGSVVHVLPLTFSEYMENRGESYEEAWREYIVMGGIPLVANMRSEEEKISYLKGLCEETYLKDIIMHNGVRKSDDLSDTFDVIASMTGTPVNALKIANTFQSVLKKKITSDTIATYIDYFNEAFVISKSKKYNIKGRKYIGTPYKLYFEDIGVRNARLDFRQVEESHLMENIIYNELRYRGFNVDVGEMQINEKSEKKDSNGKYIYKKKKLEVDFIAVKGSMKYYIQSALSISDPEKRIQEMKSLWYIDDSFKKIVITKNALKATRDERGILTIDLFDFLNDTDSLKM